LIKLCNIKGQKQRLSFLFFIVTTAVFFPRLSVVFFNQKPHPKLTGSSPYQIIGLLAVVFNYGLSFTTANCHGCWLMPVQLQAPIITS
jgi:lipoprotein signal peptidase